MPWKTPEDYDRTNVRYIRRRRNRLVYRRTAKAAALLVIAALFVFACARSGLDGFTRSVS